MTAIPQDLAPDVVKGCLEACRRCEVVVDQVVDQNEAAFASIGPHLRHCIDHFERLVEGWKSGSVDYDARPRDPLLERDPRAVRHALEAIAVGLQRIKSKDLARELSVSQSVAPGRPALASPSRLERELVFLSGHTIHHIAIMVLAARAVGVEITPGLAVAYSTEAHRNALAMSL